MLDNQTTGKAVDALLNYETVALFNNQVSGINCMQQPPSHRLQCRVAQRQSAPALVLQALEVSEYDTVLSKLQKASIKTEAISATLNAGQSVILSLGLTAVLAVAAMGSATSAMTAGDLVLVQGLLLQLWGPLQVRMLCLGSSGQHLVYIFIGVGINTF